jgi:hypothetical protein
MAIGTGGVKLEDRVLDLGLNVLDTEATHIFVNSQQPTTFTQAVATYGLGYKAFGAGSAFGAPGAWTNGRKTSSVAITDGTITTTGTVACWSAVDNTNSRLLAAGDLTGGGAVTVGQSFSLGSFDVQMQRATVATTYQGPGDITPFVFWTGLRAYSAATCGTKCVQISDSSGGNLQDINSLSSGMIDGAALATWSGAHGTIYINKFYDQTAGVRDLPLVAGTARLVLSNTGGPSTGAWNTTFTNAAGMYYESAAGNDLALTLGWSIYFVIMQNGYVVSTGAAGVGSSGIVTDSYYSGGSGRWLLANGGAGTYAYLSDNVWCTLTGYTGTSVQTDDHFYVNASDPWNVHGAGTNNPSGKVFLGTVGGSPTANFKMCEFGIKSTDITPSLTALDTNCHSVWGF